jgi:hypothetical protein
MPARFDASEWPLLIVHLEDRDDEHSVQAMLTGLEEHLRRGRCAVVYDTTRNVYPSLAEIQAWSIKEGRWLLAHQQLIATRLVGVAFVLPNPALRFVLSAVMLISPLPAPNVVFEESASALAWCREKLAAERTLPSQRARAG